MNDPSFYESPDKSQISYFLLCNFIDLFIPVAIPESDRVFNHAQSPQLSGDKGHTIWPGGWLNFSNIFGLSDSVWQIFLQFLQYYIGEKVIIERKPQYESGKDIYLSL